MSEFDYISLDPILDVSDWIERNSLVPGSREKSILTERKNTEEYFLFKYPPTQREHQLWSELLASYIAGDLLGWDVQHVSIARRDGQLGNLLRYIYDPGDDKKAQEIFIEGKELCTNLDLEYDVKKGMRHTLPLLFQLSESELLCQHYRISSEEFLGFWSRAFALDCLISNTDRHGENWAIVTGSEGSRMASLYDQGSSMGCWFDQIGLERAFADGVVKQSHLDKQYRNCRHHVRLDQPGKRGGTLIEICQAFLDACPSSRASFAAAAAIDLDAVMDVMDKIREGPDIPEPYRLTRMRQDHIHAMLQIGIKRLTMILKRV